MDNTWFGFFPAAIGFKAFRLQDNQWIDATEGAIEFSRDAKADCLASDMKLYTLLVKKERLLLTQLHYRNSDKVYRIAETISITHVGNIETATIAIDSTGMLWISGDADKQIFFYAIDATLDKSSLQGPYTLASGISEDDIGAIIAFNQNKIGVFFSDQKRSMFGFRWHKDGQPFKQWSQLEVVDDTPFCADDHLNIKADNAGGIYAAVKTSFDDIDNPPGKTLIAMYHRSADAKWSDMISVAEFSRTSNPSRPMLQIDPENNKCYVFYNNYSNGSIEMTEAQLPLPGDISSTTFNSPRKVLVNPNNTLVDVSGAKGIVNANIGILIVASGRRVTIVESRLLSLNEQLRDAHKTTKGPFILRLEQNRAAIMWESNKLQTEYISFGTDGLLTQRIASEPQVNVFKTKSGIKKNSFVHKVWLTNLQPDKTYTYQLSPANSPPETYQFRTSALNQKSLQ